MCNNTFCFVSDVLQAFFSSCLSFLVALGTSKYTTILHIFGTFLDKLREKVLGGSMWNIRVLTVDGMKRCQFLKIPLFLQVTWIFATFYKKKVSTFIVSNIFPNISKVLWHLVIFGCFMLFFPMMNFKMSHYFWLPSITQLVV